MTHVRSGRALRLSGWLLRDWMCSHGAPCFRLDRLPEGDTSLSSIAAFLLLSSRGAGETYKKAEGGKMLCIKYQCMQQRKTGPHPSTLMLLHSGNLRRSVHACQGTQDREQE